MADKINSIFEELREKGIIGKKRLLKENNKQSNFKSGLFNTTYYNSSFKNASRNTLLFFLLHEEGHHQNPQRINKLIWAFLILEVLLFIFSINLSNLLLSINIFMFNTFLLVLFFIGITYLVKSWLKKDEYEADLYACKNLKEEYSMAYPSKIVKSSIAEVDKVLKAKREKKNVFMRTMYYLVDYHPKPDQRVEYIRDNLE